MLGCNVKLYWMNLFLFPCYPMGNVIWGCGNVLAWKGLWIRHNIFHILCTPFGYVAFDAIALILYGCLWFWLHLLTTQNPWLSTWGLTIRMLIFRSSCLIVNAPCEIAILTFGGHLAFKCTQFLTKCSKLLQNLHYIKNCL